jgi:cytochrome c551/c552
MKNVIGMIATTVGLLVACSQQSERPPAQSERPPATLAELESLTTADDSQEIATYIFENYGCENCHTITNSDKFGFTERGRQIKSKSEGCPTLLGAVRQIAVLPEADRTEKHHEKLAHFEEYGCTACHRIFYGFVGLTEIGVRLRSLHLSCSDLQRVLN